MILQWMRQLFNRRPALRTAAGACWSLLPERITRSKDYFEVLRLNRLSDQGEANKELLQNILKAKLVSILQTALTSVPYYMESVAVKANEINQSNVEDALRTFPYLERSTVMDNRDAFLNRHVSKQFLFSARSSGSSGQGIVVWRSKADYDIESWN